MTALDQAFIKAFGQQRATPALRTSAPVETAGAAPIAAPSNLAAGNPAERSHRPAATLRPASAALKLPPSAPDAPRAPLPSLRASLGAAWTELPPPRPSTPSTSVPPRTPPRDDRIVQREQDAASGRDDSLVRADAKNATVRDARAETDELTPAKQDEREDSTQATMAAAASLPELEEFKAAWQVPSFTWPRVCRHMFRQAGDQLRALADAILAASRDGRAVFALAGCRLGEGATTLALCVARQLAQQGIHTIVVDADCRRPALAKRLGVQPQVGWDEANESCEQAVIESSANHLAVLPLKEPVGEPGTLECDWNALAARLRHLRGPYGVVLVDVGPLDEVGLNDRTTAERFARAIDGMLLVRNERVTSSEELDDMQRRLFSTGVALLGVVENCVGRQSDLVERAAA